MKRRKEKNKGAISWRYWNESIVELVNFIILPGTTPFLMDAKPME